MTGSSVTLGVTHEGKTVQVVKLLHNLAAKLLASL